MTLYVDTSALLKLYVEEAESAACEAYLAGDDDWVTGRHTFVEARRNLARLLDSADRADAVAQLTDDWERFRVVELDAAVCSAAAEVAEQSGLTVSTP